MINRSLIASSLALLCLASFVAAQQFNPAAYTWSKQVHSEYKIYWRTDATKLYLALDVNTRGWIGFGIGEQTSGSMPGGDFVTIEYPTPGNPVAKDRWNNRFGLPYEDCSQDWTLVAVSTLNNGRVVAELSRLLDTNDPQDRQILPGLTRVLFAWGSGSEVSYHGPNRGLDSLEFVPDANATVPTLPADAFSLNYVMSDFAIPPQETTYACRSFALPSDKPYHAVAIDAIIDTDTAAYVHHFLVYLCKYENTSSNYPNLFANSAGSCGSPIGVPGSGCSMVAYVWASGIKELRLPEQAGFPVGSNTNYLVIEIHYNNPTGAANLRDSSGVKVTMTPTLRPNEAATLVIGDPFVNLPPIPARTAAHHIETSCPSECTRNWPHDINVIGSFQHMHMHGKRMWSTHWRGSERIGENMNRVDFYSYNLQQLTRFNRVIKRGDRLNTHCVFSSSDSDAQVRFGVNTHDEMCMEFVTYWPRLYFPTNRNRTGNLCGYISNTQSICGDSEGVILPVANPVARDPTDINIVTYGNVKPGCVPASSVTKPPAAASPASTISSSLLALTIVLSIMVAFLLL